MPPPLARQHCLSTIGGDSHMSSRLNRFHSHAFASLFRLVVCKPPCGALVSMWVGRCWVILLCEKGLKWYEQQSVPTLSYSCLYTCYFMLLQCWFHLLGHFQRHLHPSKPHQEDTTASSGSTNSGRVANVARSACQIWGRNWQSWVLNSAIAANSLFSPLDSIKFN